MRRNPSTFISYLHEKERILLSGVDSDSLNSLVHALTFNDDLVGNRVYMGNFLIKQLEIGLIGCQCQSRPLPSRRSILLLVIHLGNVIEKSKDVTPLAPIN